MNFWRIGTDAHYHYLALKHENDARALNFSGKSLIDSWYPLQVEIVALEGKTLSDFPAMTGGTLVCNERSLEVIFPFIGHSIEVLPLQSEHEKFYIINVLDMVDCLDHELSEIEYFKSGNIKAITRYTFREKCLRNRAIFKIVERKGGPIFVSDTFKKIVEQNGLRGLNFREIWEE